MKVKGILGVATYVTSHKVKIYYDAALINERGLQAETVYSAKKNYSVDKRLKSIP